MHQRANEIFILGRFRLGVVSLLCLLVLASTAAVAQDDNGFRWSAVGLLVVSACSTGRGQLAGAEGVFGLKRAFTVTGAKRLLLSLWDVSDSASTEMMMSFYEALGKGLQPAQALREAKLAMIKDDSLSHPALWAPFVLIGTN